MKKFMEIVTGIYSFLIFYIGTFLIHIVTCVAVYENYGFFLGILAFFSPVISTIIMFLLYLIFYGLFNGYCIFILGYLGLVVFAYILAYIAEEINQKEKKQYAQPSNNIIIEENSKYIKLSNIVMNGLNVSSIDEALNRVYRFYKEQGIDVDSVQLDVNNKYKSLSMLVMLALGTTDINKAIIDTSTFYQSQQDNKIVEQ